MEVAHSERLLRTEERAIYEQHYRRRMKPISAAQPACYMCMVTNEKLST